MKTTRRIVQLGFLTLALAGALAWRANVEAWCPLGGVEALFTYLREGNMLCSLGVSNLYVLGALIVTTLLFRRAFCGYVCPLGAVSEWMCAAGAKLGVKRIPVSRAVDRALSLLKYVVLGLILWFTWQAGELLFRGFCPYYAAISRHGADITPWAYGILAAVVLASLAVASPFCRWFCPLAAVLNPLSRFALMRVGRTPACIDCGRCAEACPMSIPVDRLARVTASRCITCLNCMDACPTEGALRWSAVVERDGARPWFRSPRLRQGLLIVALLLGASGAVAATYLFPLPSFVKASEAAPPATIAAVDLKIANLSCRGRANLLVWFLQRDDLYRIPGAAADRPGYFKLEAWPDPVLARARISYDPTFCDLRALQEAITEPYYDAASDRWWMSPFVIEGYDPLEP